MLCARANVFQRANRIIVKVGTSTLTYPNGELNLGQIERIVREMVDLANQGKELVLVSSGAIGVGMGRLGLRRRPQTIPEKQAVAAVGQGLLMQIYEKLFGEYGRVVAQVLLTRGDVADRRRYLNARNAFLSLLNYQVIPIVNENDTVAVEEIKFGDNDTLSALVASLLNADLLIILTDIDGLYDADPRFNSSARLLSRVEEITPEVEYLAGGAGSERGTGGMFTKIQAAKIAVSSGVGMVIASSRERDVIRRVCGGEELGTFFVPRPDRLDSRKRWIAFNVAPAGSITVDQGARKAIVEEGKSLLPTGVIRVQGDFEIGDAVCLIGPDRQEFGRGLANYSAREVEKIMGRKTREIEKILGHCDYDEIVHRDNLVCFV